jgi:glycosyltransferase involved in cell wall biosynthesis
MNRQKLLFISSFNSDILQINGVAKKLYLEIKTFRDFGYSVDFIEIKNEGCYLHQENNLITYLCPFENGYHNTFILLYKILKSESLYYDVIYFRYEHISFSMLRFFRKMKNKNNTLIIGELPTYMKRPYKNSSLKIKIAFYVKKILNNYLPKQIDYIVTFSDHDKLFRTKTIKIENFIDIELIKKRKLKIKKQNTCNILTVAQLTPAHGIDLVIEGLYNYYKCSRLTKCYFHIVGNGNILQDLKNLVEKLGQQEHVIFYGALGGEALDAVFDKCDIGIGALAIFRKKSFKLSELKIREYTARALPFVYNSYEPQLNNEFFCKKIAFKNSPVDINEIVDFYNNFEYNENTSKQMREFAEENFTADVQLGKINNIIKDHFANSL